MYSTCMFVCFQLGHIMDLVMMVFFECQSAVTVYVGFPFLHCVLLQEKVLVLALSSLVFSLLTLLNRTSISERLINHRTFYSRPGIMFFFGRGWGGGGEGGYLLFNRGNTIFFFNTKKRQLFQGQWLMK